MADWHESAAINRQRFRRANDRTARRVAQAQPAGLRARQLIAFTCECADRDCHDTVQITLEEYERVRGQKGCYVVRIGHGIHGPGQVIATTGRYVIIGGEAPDGSRERRGARATMANGVAGSRAGA